MAASGYSGTPLVKKLGIKPGMQWLVLNAPANYRDSLGDLPEQAKIVDLQAGMPPTPAYAHLFLIKRSDLERQLSTLRNCLQQDGFVWISWPKKASRIPTEVEENLIREIALPLGWVDIKVCAVDEIWSGLKLVIRKSERKVV